jgi:hypothetical protein
MVARRRLLAEQRARNGYGKPVLTREPEPAATASPPPASFLLTVQDRVRAHVHSILAILDRELATSGPKGGHRPIDGTQVDRLASALERLLDLERVLDGRPLPGSRRPRDPEPPRRPPPRPPVAPILSTPQHREQDDIEDGLPRYGSEL